tara:strand:- start:403 stop:816 length:414 start_codon:yes stop_codon:yes gene_type:complete
MSTKIIKQEKNPFLDREEIVLEISSEIAPKIEDVKNAIGKEDNLTIVKKIHSNFGKHKFTADVLVYETQEAKDKIEVIPQKIRKKLEAEKKAEEAKIKAEEEAKAEESTEEPAKEENQENKTEESVAPEGVPSEEGK